MITDLPEFGTVVIPFVKHMPDSLDAWRDYRKYRDETLRQHGDDVQEARRLISGYFLQHRNELSRNVVVDDDRQREAWQVDAVHYAVDYWAASEASFWCEFQNDARRAASETGAGLSVVDVARKQRVNAKGSLDRKSVV